MSDKRQHSRFGASAAKRYIACPGSVALCEKAPPMPPTPDMKEGTAAHNLAELCLGKGGFDPQDLVGRFVDRLEVTPEMADAVTQYVDDVRADIAAGAEVFIEQGFGLFDFDAELWGTCDAVSFFPDTGVLKVRDYKHGAGQFVPVENNPQLKMYGLGAMMALGKPVSSVELFIYQPRCDYAGDAVRPWAVEPGDLLEFGGELADAVEAARKPDAPLNTGPQCGFCPARGICPKLYDTAVAATGTDLIPYTGQVLEPPAPESLTMDELGFRLTLAPMLRTWLNGLQAYANAEMQRGNIPTGYKAVEKQTRRWWKDAELVERQAPRAFPGVVTEDDMFTRKILSPAAFEKLVGKKDAADFVAEYVEKPKGLSLVKLSDKRPAVALSALSEFEVIEDVTSDAD